MCGSNLEWLRTEYEVINQWRISKVQSHDILTYIFVPVATATFFGSLLITLRPCCFLFISWGFSTILIIFWRVFAHIIDDTIVDTYPRIVYLEEKLSFQFTKEYLRSKWWPDSDPAWLPSMADVRNKIAKKSSLWNPLRYFQSPYGNRGHEFYNCLALFLIVIELLVAIVLSL